MQSKEEDGVQEGLGDTGTGRGSVRPLCGPDSTLTVDGSKRRPLGYKLRLPLGGPLPSVTGDAPEDTPVRVPRPSLGG